MSVQKKQFDFNSPEVQKQVEEIQHGAFMRQGTMLAFPLNFPGATIPIVSDESHITALDATPEGIIYGGTSGRQSHIIVAMFHGISGVVFDMKVVEDARHCSAVCCGKKKLVACVNGPRGGRILQTALQPLASDLIQEWGFERPEFEDLGEVVPGEPVVHAVADFSRECVVGITSRHLFRFDFATAKSKVLAEISCIGRLGLASDGNIVGLGGAEHLWSYDPRTQALHRQAIKLPSGAWGQTPLRWARDSRQGLLYTADDTGTLFSFHADHGFSSPLGKTMFTPVGPMAVTFDGRLFGFCGDGIAKMFCYDPGRKQVADLGVAISIFERRRYGYVFGDAVTGRDGEVVFGEDDDFGHLWLYYPRIQGAA
jgi:hypothetical protein